MKQTIFLAGACGAIGRRLVPLLLEAGHHVVGTTRSPERAAALQASGAEAVLLDIFDEAAVCKAVDAARPNVILHQLTDLSGPLTPTMLEAALARNARIRKLGTAHLVQAALAAGCPRIIAQSIAWAYAPGPMPFRETDPLEQEASGQRAITLGGILTLEKLVQHTPGLTGCVLRYGRLYGPGTGAEKAAMSPLHVDAAASAALLAVEQQATGVFNIAEDDGSLDCSRATNTLGWSAQWRQETSGVAG